MMKRWIILAVISVAAGIDCFAQLNVQDAAAQAAAALASAPNIEVEAARPNYWAKSMRTDLGFTNTSLFNWAAGGYNQTALTSGIDGVLSYKKDLMYWNNRIQLDYGFLYSSDKPFIQKNKDRMYFESKWGYRTKKTSKWSFTSSFNFRSQFSNTFKYINPGVEDPSRKDWVNKRSLQSGLLSPAYTDLSISIDWAPQKWLNFNLSPLTGGFTIVHDESLRANYSMELRDTYKAAESIEGYMYNMAKFQLGAKFTANSTIAINKVFTWETELILFSDYLDNPQIPRVNWDNKINWQLAKYFSLAFQTWLIYDHNVIIDGERKVQFKDFLTINFTYTFKPRK